MTVRGLGIDLVQVDRVRHLLDRFGERALDRLLTEGERAYCTAMASPAVHVAARVAAKEAAFKALAQDETGLRIGWTELEVSRDDRGRPFLVLHGRAKEAAERLSVRQSFLSMTHERSHAAAVVVLLGEPGRAQ